jgi:hypothetical protein
VAKGDRHPNKDIRKAIKEAEDAGWQVEKNRGKGHRWGTLFCVHGCKLGVWSTPRQPDTIAKRIREKVKVPSRPGRRNMTMNATTKTHNFTLFVTGQDILDDETMDALFEAGCDDALLGERDGAQYAVFDREADTFSEALASAIHTLRSTVPELQVVRIEPDELVTLASIAERSGRSREYIRLLATGERGPGGFPAPVAYADHKTRLWHWPDVAHWLTEHDKAEVEVDAEAADLVAAMNAAYGLREHGRQLRSERDLALVAEALGDNPFIRS